jgi:anti-sigma factor RsiW
MTCEDVQSWISDYADEVLLPDRVGAMFAHLAGCGDCQRFFQTALRIRAAVHAIPTEAPPETIDEAIIERLRGARSKVRPTVDIWSIRIAIPLPAALAMAVLLIVGSVVVSPSASPHLTDGRSAESSVDRIAVSVHEAMRTANRILGR